MRARLSSSSAGAARAARPAPAPRPGRRRRTPADNLANQQRKRAEAGLERKADEDAKHIRRGERRSSARNAPAPRTLAPPGSGRPLGGAARQLGETALGEAAGNVRIHDDEPSQLLASALQARAFADGSDIWLGPGESEHDRELLAHELAHVAQGEPGLHLRSATWLERRAWRSFFDHYLPRKFLDNYMDDTGTPITLSQQEMIDVNPIVNIRASPAFAEKLEAQQKQVQAYRKAGTPAPAVSFIEVDGPGQALTNGTLGNFTIKYRGVLSVAPDGQWVFSGLMEFYDVWDFDPKPFGTSGRSTAGEVKTRVAAAFLPGRSFEIFSVATPCAQTSADRRATWAGGSPQFVNDRAGRAGADIEVSGAGGEIVGGPVGAAGGVEVGAQSAEDLNR